MDSLKQINCSYINGNYVKPVNHASLFPNYYPATNKVINQTAFASDDDLQAALDSSLHAYKIWSVYSVNQRSNILLKAAALLRERITVLSRLEVWDTGKPIAEALSVDVHSAADCLEYFAKVTLAVEDKVMPNTNALIYTSREPLGVCVGIGAWNYPLQIACWKAGPALMMGNSMIYKPSELTPMTTLALAEIFTEAGLPHGTFNVVLGNGAVAEKILRLPSVAKVSFTGSVPTGKKILEQTASSLIPTTLELGGKSPLIIFADANLEQAAIGCMLANFYTQGEICSNGTRVFVERKCYAEFIKALIKHVEKLIIGDPFDTNTQIGSLISREHQQKVSGYIEQGIKEGATLLYGGKTLKHGEFASGNFIEPTIFTDCRDEMAIVKDEIFGPVMAILIFDEEDEAIERSNNTHYGLAGGIFTENLKRAHRVARKLQVGVCWINNYNATPVSMPFGGYKLSGMGRENGMIALSHYSQLKSIYVELHQIEHTYR
jgi:betaine-aldehyde dehydrogenase